VLPRTSDQPCYEEGGNLCSWVYDRTGDNETLANLSHFLVDRPLRILLVLLVAWILAWLARRWVKRLVGQMVADNASRLGRLGIELPKSVVPTVRDPRRESRAASISVVLTSTVVTSIWVIAGMIILGIVGINLAPLIAGAGIAGVALGFGAQSLVKDCIAGLFMLIEDQYGIGDVVDLGEATGVVEEISLRTTVLRGLDGTVWHVPNGVVERVGNKSQLWSVALLDVDVAYDTDLEWAQELLLRAATEVCERDEFEPIVVEPPTVLGVEALGADGITLRLTIKTTPGSQWALQRAIRAHIKTVFDDASVEIPFPQRTVWMRDDNPTSDAAATASDDTEQPSD
jgi:small-conductance mechanosensitive channel